MSSAYLHSCTTRPNPEKRTKFQMHRRTTPPKKRGYDPAAELVIEIFRAVAAKK